MAFHADSSKEMRKILRGFQKKFTRCHEAYRNSTDLGKLLAKAHQDIRASPRNLCAILDSLFKQLNLHRVAEADSSQTVAEEIEGEDLEALAEMFAANEDEEIDFDDEKVDEMVEKAWQRNDKVRKLEKLKINGL